jgi:hypothetical protein
MSRVTQELVLLDLLRRRRMMGEEVVDVGMCHVPPSLKYEGGMSANQKTAVKA